MLFPTFIAKQSFDCTGSLVLLQQPEVTAHALALNEFKDEVWCFQQHVKLPNQDAETLSAYAVKCRCGEGVVYSQDYTVTVLTTSSNNCNFSPYWRFKNGR